jgi:hypothetical protein
MPLRLQGGMSSTRFWQKKVMMSYVYPHTIANTTRSKWYGGSVKCFITKTLDRNLLAKIGCLDCGKKR